MNARNAIRKNDPLHLLWSDVIIRTYEETIPEYCTGQLVEETEVEIVLANYFLDSTIFTFTVRNGPLVLSETSPELLFLRPQSASEKRFVIGAQLTAEKN